LSFFVQVVDNVLKEQGVGDSVLYNRAKVGIYYFIITYLLLIMLKGLLILGAIFKSTKADESDEERRELERFVVFVSEDR
jgi:cytochrome b subunit of formate dehydrogenase